MYVPIMREYVMRKKVVEHRSQKVPECTI